ncbi:thiamine pyrophosphate-binding protein [Halorarum halophilum]|uniref:Thiamine pyrophosphate-binding protein n=1 Tax=Halorarum halophilum TaxID=2743090 RepID=A0A7D5GZA5_9EURY|nr:thiamine pyrophosphate-binding protein [Halobaculum halophilum]
MVRVTDEKRGGDYVYEALLDAGVDLLVGIPGTQTLPLDRTVVERDEMDYVMARHETAIPHVAWGYYESGGGVAATLTVPGPGDTNAMHGLKNAYDDCVPVFHVSADVNPEDRGKSPIHEIEADTFDNVVKENVTVESGLELPADMARGIEAAFEPPTGPVRFGVPSRILDESFHAPAAEVSPERTTWDADADIDAATALLADAERPVVYVGGGARRSPGGVEAIRGLVEDLDAPVAVSYKGKGVFPEDDPRFLGVTGSHIPPGAKRVLDRADVVLALGTNFDGITTANWSLPMGDRLIHVTLDPESVDVAYEADVAVLADVADAVESIRDGLEGADGWDGGTLASAVREEYREALDALGLFDDGHPLNTPGVLDAVRTATPDDAVVTTDVGGFRLWSKQVFEAYDPETYVTAGSWGGMGVGLPAAIGAAFANPEKPVVCLTGDGGLMMCIHELHTAAEYDLNVTVVVSNNADYGIISKSPKIDEYTEGHQFTWNSPEFVTVAEGFGCRGTHVESLDDLRDAVTDAVGRDGPDLIDVPVETDEPSAPEAAAYESTVELL